MNLQKIVRPVVVGMLALAALTFVAGAPAGAGTGLSPAAPVSSTTTTTISAAVAGTGTLAANVDGTVTATYTPGSGQLGWYLVMFKTATCPSDNLMATYFSTGDYLLAAAAPINATMPLTVGVGTKVGDIATNGMVALPAGSYQICLIGNVGDGSAVVYARLSTTFAEPTTTTAPTTTVAPEEPAAPAYTG